MTRRILLSCCLLLAPVALADQFNDKQFATKQFATKHFPTADSGGEPPTSSTIGTPGPRVCLGTTLDCRRSEL